MVEQRKDLAGQTFGREFVLRNEPSRGGSGHFLRVAKLMAVGRTPKRNENGGAPCCRDFGSRNRACAAHNQVSPGKPFGHVAQKRNHLGGVKFPPCVGSSYRVVIALTGLVDYVQFILPRGEKVHGVHKRAIDWQRALAAPRNKQTQRLLRSAWSDGEKVGANRIP